MIYLTDHRESGILHRCLVEKQSTLKEGMIFVRKGRKKLCHCNCNLFCGIMPEKKLLQSREIKYNHNVKPVIWRLLVLVKNTH